MILHLLIIFINIIFSQNIRSNDLDFDTNDKFIKHTESFILEDTIDPNTYVLGPGDKIGLNIASTSNLTYIMTITPIGDLWIPEIGTVKVSGLVIAKAEKIVKQYIQKYRFSSAEVNLVLLNMRKFSIQVIGAVNNPGFINITSLERLSSAIHKTGGLHKFANEEEINIIGNDNIMKNYSLKRYQIDGNLKNNPIIKFGDVIHIPYMDKYLEFINKNSTFKRNPIIVTGFVINPASHKYIIGYSVLDYIALSGGVSDFGSFNNIKIIRNGEIVQFQNNDLLPGDQIHIAANLKYRFLGNISILQTTTAIMSLILAFLATTN